MMIIKWILLIALFKYSHEQKSFPNIKTFLDSTTTTVKPKTFRLVTTHVAKDPSAPVEVILKFNST